MNSRTLRDVLGLEGDDIEVDADRVGGLQPFYLLPGTPFPRVTMLPPSRIAIPRARAGVPEA